MEAGVEEGAGVLAVLPGPAGPALAFLNLEALVLQLGGFQDGPQAANLKVHPSPSS